MASPDLTGYRGLAPESIMLAYGAVLASIAGFVNAVALLIMAVPVGNLTGITTQLGMDTAHPWRYESHVLGAILLGFLVGAAIAGALLAPAGGLTGPRPASVLLTQAVLLLLAAVGAEESEVKQFFAAVGIEQTAVQALLAAAALGLQNGLTSSFRGMPVRTTHFTGTVTDLGLMLGRVRRHGIDKWKAAILTATLLLFLAGGIGGILAGAKFGGYALLIPATMCVVVATAHLLQNRYRRGQAEVRGVPAESPGTSPRSHV
jgi:uncharacterized membrane protein YoaK (UPF0700 family)